MVLARIYSFVDGELENRRGENYIRIHVSKYLMKVFYCERNEIG